MFKETRSWCALLLSLLAPLAGAETPPEAELSSLQAVDAEPLSEPDPTADPDNQERA